MCRPFEHLDVDEALYVEYCLIQATGKFSFESNGWFALLINRGRTLSGFLEKTT